MNLNPSRPILYLITPGATTESATLSSREIQNILSQVRAAADAGIQLIQLREKNLTARVLFELTERVMEIVRGGATRVLVNDRADVAAGAGANGVHLTTRSLGASVIRKTFGPEFLIGVSTHNDVEVRRARDAGADFAVFGPVFSTASKAKYGPALGPEKLSQAARASNPFPVLAIGGVSMENIAKCLCAGASGIAAITLFTDPAGLNSIAELARRVTKEAPNERQIQ